MKSNRILRISALTLAVALAPAARAQDVSVDYDKSVDFSKYQTFAIEIGTTWGNPIGEKRVLEEFTKAFEGKGWKTAPKEEASALVALHGATEKRHDLDTFYSGYGGYRFRRGFGTVTATTTVHDYTVGTLVVDVFDAKTKELLWRGTAQDELKDKPEKREKQLAKASEKLLKNFPPGKKPD